MNIKTEKSKQEKAIFYAHFTAVAKRMDVLFGRLFILQWIAAILIAFFVSPLTWRGNESTTHIHVYAAIFLGGLLTVFPLYMIHTRPGTSFNRAVIATAQMGFSMLLIHLTGGRIETHFHVFGSLAFLSMYRDYRPVLLATLITSADHLLRGAFWPESVYGLISATPWRAIEHAGWVVFEDVFLILFIKMGLEELWTMSTHQAIVESTLATVEKTVEERTSELKQTQDKVLAQQQALIASGKMSSLGEMAGGIAHEINTPLAIINLRVEQLQEVFEEGQMDDLLLLDTLKVVKTTTNRIAKIVTGLRSFARDGRKDGLQNTTLDAILEDTLSLCRERFKNHGVSIIEPKSTLMRVQCRPIEISQILLNLLNNAFDAVSKLPEKWIRIDVTEIGDRLEISITDSGPGIPAEVQEKLMQPFFTTKDIGKGTGLGLSVSRGMVESHHGQMFYDSASSNTRFVVRLPKTQPEQKTA